MHHCTKCWERREEEKTESTDLKKAQEQRSVHKEYKRTQKQEQGIQRVCPKGTNVEHRPNMEVTNLKIPVGTFIVCAAF